MKKNDGKKSLRKEWHLLSFFSHTIWVLQETASRPLDEKTAQKPRATVRGIPFSQTH